MGRLTAIAGVGLRVAGRYVTVRRRLNARPPPYSRLCLLFLPEGSCLSRQLEAKWPQVGGQTPPRSKATVALERGGDASRSFRELGGSNSRLTWYLVPNYDLLFRSEYAAPPTTDETPRSVMHHASDRDKHGSAWEFGRDRRSGKCTERGGRDVTSNQALVRAPQTDPAEGTAGHGDRLAAVLNNGVEHPV